MDKFEYEEIDWKVPIERTILIDKKIDNQSLRLYLILLSYARDKIIAFPSRETLANDMNCSVRNVDIIKNKLKKLGLLDWETCFNGTNKYNVYKLLKYKPIQKDQPKAKLKKDQPKTKSQKEKKVINGSNEKIEEVIDIYKKSYREFCEKSKDLREMVKSGWLENPDYIPTRGDLRNLQWYYDTYGEDSLKKLGIGFRFLGSYLRDAIEYGDFYTNQGSELIPTISLFTKAKTQHDKIMRFALDELKKKTSQDDFKEAL